MLITLILLGVLLLIDILTKYLAELMITPGTTINLIPNFLDTTLVYNKGAAWSSFASATWFLALLSFLASAVLVYFITKNNWKTKKCYSTSITLMLAGTYGNFIDRVMAVFNAREGVVDMIIFKPLDWAWKGMTGSSFPIFNFADMCLVIGIVLLAIDIIFFQEKRAVK